MSKGWKNEIKKLEVDLIATEGNSSEKQASKKFLEDKEKIIQDLKRKLKIIETDHPQTQELLDFQKERDDLNKETLKLKAKFLQLKTTKEKVDQSKANSSQILDLKRIWVKDQNIKKLQYGSDKINQEIQEKGKALEQSISEKYFLQQQLQLTEQSLIESKYLMWDHITSKMKNIKDYFVQVEDEREFSSTVSANIFNFKQMLGDKPSKAQNFINYLNSRTKVQLNFVGIDEKEEIISHVRKYIIKNQMMKDLSLKTNFMKARISDFKIIFTVMFLLGFPRFWNSEGFLIPESEYHMMFLAKINDISSINQINTNMKGDQKIKILKEDIFLLYEVRKVIVSLPLVTYTFYLEIKEINIEMLAVYFPSSSIWKKVSIFVDKWNVSDSSLATSSRG